MISDSRPRVRFRPTAGLLVGLAFASPWLIGFVVFTAGPIIASAYYSLTNFDLFQLPQFVGFQNYVQLSQDPVFWQSLENTLFLTVIGLPVGLALALVCAMVLNLPVRGQPLYRAIAYLPAIVPVVVATYLWRWLFNGQYGFINQFLGALHLPQPAWLEDPAWTKPAVLIIIFWTIGTTTMIYLAALKEVPRELYEAAEVDGARWWSRFRHVTWPTITPVTLFQLIVGVIAYLQVFTQPLPYRSNAWQLERSIRGASQFDRNVCDVPLPERLQLSEDGIRISDGLDTLRTYDAHHAFDSAVIPKLDSLWGLARGERRTLGDAR